MELANLITYLPS